MISGLFIYVYILLGLFVLVFDTTEWTVKPYNRAFNFLFLLLAFLSAFSYGVGPDTGRYIIEFNNFHDLPHLTKYDFSMTRDQPLYVLVNSLCKTIYDDFLTLQLLQVFLLYHSLYLVLRMLDLRKIWLLFLFFGSNYISVLSGRRECFGLACCLYAMLFYINNRWIFYYILVILGFLFHSGMFVFALFPLLKLLEKVTIINVVVVVVSIFLVQYLFEYIQVFDDVVNDDDSILRYSFESDNQLKFSTGLYVFIQLLIFFWMVVKENGNFYDGYEKDFIYLSFFSVSLVFLSASLPIIYRYRVHFAVFSYFTIRECFKKSNKKLIVALLFVIFSYSPVATFIATMHDHPSVFNYCSVFSSDYDKAMQDFILNNNYIIQQ